MIYGRAIDRQSLKKLLAADRQRFDAFNQENDWPLSYVSKLAVWLYRWSFYHHGHGRRGLGRVLWQLNLWLTGVDITPITDIGAGLLLLRPKGVTLFGVIGEGFTAESRVVVGGGASRVDIGAGPGRPLIGNDVYMAVASMVLGPVRIGDGARLDPGAVAMRNLEAAAHLHAAEPLVVSRHA